MIAILPITALIISTFSLILSIKNRRTYNMRSKIADAIFQYDLYMISECRYDECRDYYDYIEPYNKTLWRLWDWGYTRILPPEIFEKIKPYIE